MTPRRRTIALLGVQLVVSMAAGAALGWWRATATGVGSAASALMHVNALTVSNDDPNDALVPGGSADLVIRVQNPNDFAVRLYSVEVGPGNADKSGCEDHDIVRDTDRAYNATLGSFLDAQEALGPGETRVVRLPDAIRMNLDAAASCQGASFSFPVGVEVRA